VGSITPLAGDSRVGLLDDIGKDEELLEIGRLAVENELIARRDSRIGIIGRNNGLVCKERNGEPSDIIRMPPEEAIRIALDAIADYIKG
jgi:hypothetical protein